MKWKSEEMYAIFEFKKLKEECVVLLWNRNKTKHTAISVLASQVYKMDSTICTVHTNKATVDWSDARLRTYEQELLYYVNASRVQKYNPQYKK